MNKDDIRRHVRARKQLLDDTERLAASRNVFQRLERLAAFTLADTVLLYHSLPDELYTHEFLNKWHDSKRFFLPRVNGIDLEILPYSQSRLRSGAFRIEEPEGDDVYNVDSIELIVVPGVAYDRNGNRVGRGRGYYDRLLAKSKALKVGVAYEFQIFDEIATDTFDVPVDIVITEAGTYHRRR